MVSMPSIVSDWLEEQLEARGIDAVVYTRYILSLLHTRTIDLISPDDDLQLSPLKVRNNLEIYFFLMLHYEKISQIFDLLSLPIVWISLSRNICRIFVPAYLHHIELKIMKFP